MTFKSITAKTIFVLTFFLLTNYSSAQKSVKNIQNIYTANFERTEIICDTVYKNKHYKFTLTLFDTLNNFVDQANTIFTFEKLISGQYKVIYRDTIYCEMQELSFEKFTPKNIKSVLVKNNADIRSNWTYYLYMVDTAHDRLKKIRGFEEIKNPNYLRKYNLIDNYVMSGKIWTNFYKIIGDTIKDFHRVIYDDQKENGTYDRDYKKALKSILMKEKNNR